jgi:carboxylesterase
MGGGVMQELTMPINLHNGQETGLLFIHGFTATPSELLPVARLLHEKGIDVYGPLLPGHGTSKEDLNQKTWADWYRVVTESITRLRLEHQWLFIAGLSMGGLLALLAAAEQKDLDGVIVINAPIFYYPAYVNEWTLRLLRKIRSYWPKEKKELENRFSYTHYPVEALLSMELMRKRVKAKLKEISIPAMVVQSGRDNDVPVKSTDYIARALKIPREQVVFLPNSHHVATMAAEKEQLAARMLSFMENIRRTQAGMFNEKNEQSSQ